MMKPDTALRQDVERRVAAGITPEMATAQRRRFVTLHGLILFSLLLNLLVALASRPASSWQIVISAVAVVVLVAFTVRGYLRLVPQTGVSISDAEVTEVASRSHRCERCQDVMLPEDDECPQCGVLRHPRWTLAFGIAFGVGMTILALWRAGFFKQ